MTTISDGADELEPFRQFVVKIHGRCNLACDYCYVYEHVDQTWRERPAAMSTELLEVLADRIATHAKRHGLDQIQVVLHGGEPLLAGRDRIRHAVEAIRSRTPAGTAVRFAVQTNGVRLTDSFLKMLAELGINVGVSLDGGLPSHNKHRLFTGGRDSFPAVVTALSRLRGPGYRDIYGGILCTIDLANDPIEVYRSLLDFNPPTLNFLFPLGNWTNPPPGRPVDDPRTPYGDWLITIFDEWYGSPVRRTAIRLFDSIIAMVLGGYSETEQLGLSRTFAITVDTDGSIQCSDALKTTSSHAPETGLDIVANSFDDALTSPQLRAEQRTDANLPNACRRCPVVRICGGGLHAHRFHIADGFSRRSVYCRDLFRLIRHIRDRVRSDLAHLVPDVPVPT